MAIPVHDSVPVRRTPWVTYLLIAANVVIFLFTPVAQIAGVETDSPTRLCEIQAYYDRYGAIPEEMLDNRQLPVVATGEAGIEDEGAYCVIGPPAYVKIPVLSVLSAMFLHGGWLHLLGNMLFLWVFGNNIEDRLGRLRYGLFYLLCGYVAAYGFALANPSSAETLVGASGAISGVLGAYLVLYPKARITSLVPFLLFLPVRLPAWLMLGVWFGVQWLYSAGYATTEVGSVAYLAHVLGFVTGVLIAIPLRKQGTPEPHPRRRVRRNRGGR